MSSSPNLYRYIEFIGGNILDAQNVQLLQSILSTQPAALETIGATGPSQVYQQGTLLNAVFNITGTGGGTAIVMTHANTNFPIYVLVNGQFESLGNTVSIAGSQPTSGSHNLFLNWSLNIITSAQDPTFVDGETGEPTIEAGQIALDVDWADTSGVSLNPSTQFAKNTATIILASFNFSNTPITSVTYVNGVFPYAVGTPTQAGLVSLTLPAAWIAGNAYTLGQVIVDSNGNLQEVTTAGTSNGSVPAWNATPAGTTVEGGASTLIWTNEGVANLGEALNSTDTAVTNDRNPNPLSVYDSSVANLISSGTNSSSLPVWAPATVYSVGTQIIDSNGNIEIVVSVSGTGTSGGSAPAWNVSFSGTTVDNAGANQVVWSNAGPASTTKYDPATANQGGIFTDKIIYNTLKQKLTTFLDNIGNSIQSILTALKNHIGQPLGSSETHPFPTAAQVGAAPASHVGLPLGLSTSHPALVNSDTSGFSVDELTGSTSGDAYGVYSDSSSRKAAIQHSGDVYSIASGAFTASALEGDGATPDPNNGTLFQLSKIAAILADHVNFNVTGQSPVANNPHNIHPGDIGAASQAYVDSTVAAILAAAQGYATARTNISVRKVVNTLPLNNFYIPVIETNPTGSVRLSGNPPVWESGFGGIPIPVLNSAAPAPGRSQMTYLIFTFGSTSGLATLPMWQPNNYYNLGFQVIDTNGNIQQITAVGSDGFGISSGAAPSWNVTLHGTTSDGSGVTSITWTNEGPATALAGFEIAFGTGSVIYQGGPLFSNTGSPHGDSVPIPEVTPANNPSIPWTYSKAVATASGQTTIQHTDTDDFESIQVAVDPVTFQVYGFSRTSTHGQIDAGVANVFAVFYRQL